MLLCKQQRIAHSLLHCSQERGRRGDQRDLHVRLWCRWVVGGVSWEERGSWGKEGGVDGVVGGSEAAATIPPPPGEGRTQKAQAPLICGPEQNKTTGKL